MEQVFPMERGRLVCRTRGNQVEVTMTLRPTGPGLYRGILCGKTGRIDLGTLLPEGEGLALCRTLSVDHLSRRGCWPITGGRWELRYAFGQKAPPKGWQRRSDLPGLFADRILSQAVEKETGLLWRQEEGGFSLAAPWAPKAPFPLVPVFCFARVEIISGQPWVVVSFAREGRPILPPSCQTGESGVQYP